MKNGDNKEPIELPEMDYREWMIKETFQNVMSQVWANTEDSSFSWKTFLRLLRNKRNKYDRPIN